MFKVFNFPDYGDNADVKFFKNLTLTPGTVSQTIFTGGSEAVTGLQRLAQMVVLRLGTPRGGMLYESSEGSQLMTDVLRGVIRTNAQLVESFMQSRDDILRQFARDAVQFPYTAPDEILSDLGLLSSSVSRGSINLYIKVVSLAGSNIAFNTPLTIV